MKAINFLITGVGGQGTLLAGDLLAAVGLAAGYDVKKSDILGLAVRGGAVVGHVRWAERVFSPIVPDGQVDFLVAFEVLEGLRWLHHVRPEGTVLLNQQEIHPVTVSSGLTGYPDPAAVDRALGERGGPVFKVPGLELALRLGNPRVLNVVLLGALSSRLPLSAALWQQVLKNRVPGRYLELNEKAFEQGRTWAQERSDS